MEFNQRFEIFHGGRTLAQAEFGSGDLIGGTACNGRENHNNDPHAMAQLIAQQFQRLPKRTRVIVATCLFGLVGGLVAVAFHYAIHFINHFTYERFVHESKPAFLIKSFLLIMSTSLVVGWLLNSFCKEASGSGVPQLKLAYWKEFGVVAWRTVWVKFVAGALSIGGGCSLGREGPSVQMAGGLASIVAGKLGTAKQRRRLAAASGAAAGLAAAFNTPVAAVTFVLEEMLQDLNSRYLGSILLASFIGALVAHALIGESPAFLLRYVESPGLVAYALTPVVAALAALVGMYFQKSTMALRARRLEFKKIPGWLRPAMGGGVTWILGSSVFLLSGSAGVFGLGYTALSEALAGQFDWSFAALLLSGKLLATIACYGFGGCGGIFSPTLFFGCMCGIVVSGLVGLVLPLHPTDNILLAVIGMSACMGAVVRAPVTSILIVFEMTHEFALVPPLMLGTLVSQAVSRSLAKQNFYEELLVQDGHDMEHVIPPRDMQSWQQLHVSTIATFKPVILRDLTPETLKLTLKNHPYLHFPVMFDQNLTGVLSRAEAERALNEERKPRLEEAVDCRPAESIRDLQMKLIESTSGIVVLTDRPGGRVLGLVTLHDLFRAEVAIADAAEE